jgi:glycosyltransferase involved in cell wall biosynthesis
MNTVSLASVGVIMTCYNEGPYIGPAVRSVLDQSRADLIAKIVIADDGSDAATVAVLKDIETWDSRIVVLYGPGGAGLPAQRNLAAAQIDTPYLGILDGDDLWRADKLELQVPILEQRPEVGLVYSDYFAFPNDDLVSARRAGVLDLTGAADLTLAYFLNDPPIIPSTILLRRSAFDACGQFDAAVRIFEDTEFYLRASRACRFALVNEPLLYKRYRGTSITGGRSDLMAHHAFVALKAASVETRLLPLVPRRLAERARKLGNQRFLLGDHAGAARLLGFALQLQPTNARAWASYLAVRFFPKAATRLMGAQVRERQAALGIQSA